MKAFTRRAVAVLFAAGLCGPAFAETALVAFDDLHTADYATNGGVVSPQPVTPLPPVAIGNGYAGLNWNNFYAINGYLVGGQIDNLAPYQSVISKFNEAVSYQSIADIASSTEFSLVSGYFNSLSAFNLNLEVQGYAGNSLMYDQLYVLAPISQADLDYLVTNGVNYCFQPQAQLLNLQMDGVTDVRFIATGGYPVNFNQSGALFAMDNLLVSTPEPSSVILLGGGIALWLARVGFCRWNYRVKNRSTCTSRL